MPPLDINTTPAAPDYKQPEAWLVKPSKPEAPVDVFFENLKANIAGRIKAFVH